MHYVSLISVDTKVYLYFIFYIFVRSGVAFGEFRRSFSFWFLFETQPFLFLYRSMTTTTTNAIDKVEILFDWFFFFSLFLSLFLSSFTPQITLQNWFWKKKTYFCCCYFDQSRGDHKVSIEKFKWNALFVLKNVSKIVLFHCVCSNPMGFLVLFLFFLLHSFATHRLSPMHKHIKSYITIRRA